MYKCEHCRYSSARLDFLRRHVQSVHQKIRIQCDKCHAFVSKAALQRHLKSSTCMHVLSGLTMTIEDETNASSTQSTEVTTSFTTSSISSTSAPTTPLVTEMPITIRLTHTDDGSILVTHDQVLIGGFEWKLAPVSNRIYG